MKTPKILFLTFTSSVLLAACSTTQIVTSVPVAPTAGQARSTSLYYALPSVRSHLKLMKGDKDYSLDTDTEVAGPDPHYIFMVNYEASAFADDVIKVTTTTDGLLSSIDVTNEDKTGAFLIQLTDLGKQALKADSLFDKESTAKEPALIADMLVDLTSPEEVTALNSYLAAKDTGLSVTVSDAQQRGLKTPSVDASNCSISVCFRPKLAYMITIDNSKNNTRRQQMLYSPNHAPLLSLEISRANFVKKVTNVTFDKGMITSVSVTKPSEAVGFISIPIDVLKAIISIPAELVQLKIDTTNKDKDLATAQKGLLDAQKQLLEARKNVTDAASAQQQP